MLRMDGLRVDTIGAARDYPLGDIIRFSPRRQIRGSPLCTVSRRAASAAAFERDPLYAYAVTARALEAGLS
jgi:hypothetical protein